MKSIDMEKIEELKKRQNSKLYKNWKMNKTENWKNWVRDGSKLDKIVDKTENWTKLWTKLIIGKNCGQN